MLANFLRQQSMDSMLPLLSSLARHTRSKRHILLRNNAKSSGSARSAGRSRYLSDLPKSQVKVVNAEQRTKIAEKWRPKMRNVATALVLVSFSSGVYYYTVQQVQRVSIIIIKGLFFVVIILG